MELPGPEGEKQASAEPRPGGRLPSWWCLVFFLCFYGFLAQMRPGESFITPYLLGPDKNFTQKQVTNEITPVLSYSYLAVLVPIFLLTDYLRYTPVLLLQGLSYVSVWLLLLFGSTVLHMQFMEFFFSITMAARIAYSSYIFALVPPARYQRVAGYSRAAVLLGVFTSSVLGQLLVTMGRVPFSTLNYVSLAFLLFSLVLTLFLKRPQRSLFFNRSAPAPASWTPCARAAPPGGAGGPAGLGAGAPAAGAGPRPATAAAAPLVALVGLQLGRLLPDRLLRAHPVERGPPHRGQLAGLQRRRGRRLHAARCHHFLFCRLREDPLGAVGEAGHRRGDGRAGGARLPHVQHEQHLAVLRRLRALPRRLPVPGAHRHVPDRVLSFSRAAGPGLRSQHLPRHRAEDRHYCHRLRQAGPGPPGPLSVPHLLRVLPGALCRLLLRSCAGGPAPLPTGPPPAPGAGPGAEESRAREGWAGAERTGRGPGGRCQGLPGALPAARDQSLTHPACCPAR
uniref:Solute carrier family 19 member 1 n=1 Tax=Sus scrofa TaxID=9823 RepID=I3LP66_PIG